MVYELAVPNMQLLASVMPKLFHRKVVLLSIGQKLGEGKLPPSYVHQVWTFL